MYNEDLSILAELFLGSLGNTVSMEDNEAQIEREDFKTRFQKTLGFYQGYTKRLKEQCSELKEKVAGLSTGFEQTRPVEKAENETLARKLGLDKAVPVPLDPQLNIVNANSKSLLVDFVSSIGSDLVKFDREIRESLSAAANTAELQKKIKEYTFNTPAVLIENLNQNRFYANAAKQGKVVGSKLMLGNQRVVCIFKESRITEFRLSKEPTAVSIEVPLLTPVDYQNVTGFLKKAVDNLEGYIKARDSLGNRLSAILELWEALNRAPSGSEQETTSVLPGELLSKKLKEVGRLIDSTSKFYKYYRVLIESLFEYIEFSKNRTSNPAQ